MISSTIPNNAKINPVQSIDSVQEVLLKSTKESKLTPLELIFKTRVVEGGFNPNANKFHMEFEAGCYHRISHASSSTNTKMHFGLFLPSSYRNGGNTNTPVLFWLSGVACDDTTFPMRAGGRAFDAAEKNGIAIVMPDTSPHHDETEVPYVNSIDLDSNAGFYINATRDPYTQHYNMYDYITQEIPFILENNFNIGKNGHKSISGHNMGGHGALTVALRQGRSSWRSVSAFAPICNPTNSSWGSKAFDKFYRFRESGIMHDASCLLQSLKFPLYDNILIDQGTEDVLLEEQLKPDILIKAAENSAQKITLNMRQGFDHSYYFITSFIEDHVNFHSHYLHGSDSSLFRCHMLC